MALFLEVKLAGKILGDMASLMMFVAPSSSLQESRLNLKGFSYSLFVAKMVSHAIFQYNVLAIDDTHNTWTNMIVKMTILRLLGSSDDKEKVGVARP